MARFLLRAREIGLQNHCRNPFNYYSLLPLVFCNSFCVVLQLYLGVQKFNNDYLQSR